MEPILESSGTPEDITLDQTLRPQYLADYIGQGRIKDNLKIFLEAAKKRKESLEHVLIHGAPGLGKTTLANVIAREMGRGIRVTSGPALERAGDLASILTNLEAGDILFIDEVHRLNRVVEEVLYSAMEDFVLDLVLGKGPSARTLRLDLPRFTLIGATTRIGSISAPLRDRFGAQYQLDFYEDEELEEILNRSAKILKIKIEPAAIHELARRARRTPRVANRLLKRVRDYAEVKGDGRVTKELAQAALKLLEIDELGLDKTDRKILKAIIEKFKGGPVGLDTIAAATAEDPETLEDVNEPFLLQIGFLDRTNKGRLATARAYEHLGFRQERLV